MKSSVRVLWLNYFVSVFIDTPFSSERFFGVAKEWKDYSFSEIAQIVGD